MELATYASLDELPPGCADMIRPDPLGGMGWYRTVCLHALPADAVPCFAVLLQEERPHAVIPLARLAGGRQLQSLTTPYTCGYQPVLAASGDLGLVHEAGLQLGRFCKRWATVRIDAVAAEWPGLAPFTAGLRRAGLLVQRFDHFGNWHEPIHGRSWRRIWRPAQRAAQHGAPQAPAGGGGGPDGGRGWRGGAGAGDCGV